MNENNPESSSTTAVSEETPSGFSMRPISSFKRIENKYNLYRRKEDCVKKFCKSLRNHAMEIINFKKKKHGVINKRATGIKSNCKNMLHLFLFSFAGRMVIF